jgi:hypothetical protein
VTPKKKLELEMMSTVVLVRSKSRRRGQVVEILRTSENVIWRIGVLFRGERTIVWSVPTNLVVVKAAKK